MKLFPFGSNSKGQADYPELINYIANGGAVPSPSTPKPEHFRFSSGANDRVIYLSGPHGVGKSTLISDLQVELKDSIIMQEQIAHMEGLKENVSRQLWRSALHAIEHRENLRTASNATGHLLGAFVIGDRGLLDDLAYIHAFYDLGWITRQQLDAFQHMFVDAHRLADHPLPTNFILIMPPFDWNVERIKERWAENPGKWQEDNFLYLAAVRNAFMKLYHVPPSGFKIALLHQTDRRVRVQEARTMILRSSLIHGSNYSERAIKQYKNDSP